MQWWKYLLWDSKHTQYDKREGNHWSVCVLHRTQSNGKANLPTREKCSGSAARSAPRSAALSSAEPLPSLSSQMRFTYRLPFPGSAPHSAGSLSRRAVA